MAIQNDNTVVTKGDLKNLYTNKILPYLGGNMMMTTNNSEYYSEDEKVVGVWINGKPLYQKTITLQLPQIVTDGQTATTTIPFSDSRINISNPEIGWVENGFGYTNDGTMIPIMNINSAWGNNYQTAQYFVYAAFHMVQLGIMLQANRLTNSEAPIVLTVRYTKTTDSTTTALTTPGCYDLTRPDLWPKGKEIFFGDGLFGQRFTGTLRPTSTITAYTIWSSWSDTWTIINASGYIGRGVLLNACNTNLAYMLYVNSNGLNIQASDNLGSGSTNYDIWVTYTK